MITKEAYLKHKDIIDAWANGKPIEVKEMDEWNEIKNPIFNLNVEYRIKPEPEVIYRLSTNTIGDEVSGCFIYSKKEAEELMITHPKCKFQKFVAVEN